MGAIALAVLCLSASALGLSGWLYSRWLLRNWQSPKASPPLNEKERAALPNISVLLPVHNAEVQIIERLTNLLATDYPPERLEILVGCDGCTDLSANLARSLGEGRISVLEFARQGKPTTLNHLVQAAHGEWLVVADAGGRFQPHTLMELVRVGQADERIAVVSGRLDSLQPDEHFAQIEQANAEQIDRQSEVEGQRWGAVVAPWGPCFAIRRSAAHTLPVQMLLDDAYWSLNGWQQGKRSVMAWHATFTWQFAPSEASQLQRRRRLTAGNAQLISKFAGLLLRLNSSQTFVLWVKVLRWMAPLELLLGLLAWMVLTNTWPWMAVATALLATLIGLTWLFEQGGDTRRLRYLLKASLAQLQGWADAWHGIERAVWHPTKR